MTLRTLLVGPDNKPVVEEVDERVGHERAIELLTEMFGYMIRATILKPARVPALIDEIVRVVGIEHLMARYPEEIKIVAQSVPKAPDAG